ncbi:MAG: cysteine--tRNA ligase [Myxococcales bacterium]|nr:cysteine--tRNA ligase [Myxococcales bacterium]MCB9718576.1 cysteine--tRNA ligase [Myxococcales bacterium]
MPTPFRLYNTKTRRVEDFVPQQPGKVGIYVCGMTVYDRTHVGHARAMVVFDAFVRWLRHEGWEVRFVRNFTDIDDKIIARAATLGIDPATLAQDEIDAFHRDMDALGLARPDDEPRVTQTIESIMALISTLIERGHAYPAEGNVWFSVESFDHYGALSGRKVEDLRSADPDQGKRHPADFALWKAAKPGEPAWESPWGPGRPGWHIECSAMAKHCLGDTVDIHGGGLDLVFPHHENEVAQSECGNGTTYVAYWMHNGLLTMTSGQKMGKSLGNVVNIEDVLRQLPAEGVRLYYLQNHYRSPLPWNAEALPEALAMLSRLYEARDVAEAMKGSEDPERVAAELGEDAQTVLELGRRFPERLDEALREDFNTSQVLGHLFTLARAVNRFAGHKKAGKRGGPVVAPALAAFRMVAERIGIMTMATADFVEEVKDKRLAAAGLERAAVEAKVAERVRLRQAKQWAEADALRDELDGLGIVVMDGPEGSRWRVRLDVAAET